MDEPDEPLPGETRVLAELLGRLEPEPPHLVQNRHRLK
jgi:hypothetical protein